MSTLSVSQIQNTASPVTNIVVNADGTVTIGLYNAGIAPTPVQTGTLWYDVSGVGLTIWDGSGWQVVAPVAGTIHDFVQSATPTAYSTGDLWYDTALERQSTWDGANWVQSGTTWTSPTGASILSSGTTADRAAVTPGAAGYTRYNTSTDVLEYWNVASASWDVAGGIEPGTRMIFQQTAAPTGWVKDTTYNNYAMRLVNGAVGTGGTVGFTTAFAGGLNSGGTALTIAQMPSHGHGVSDPGHLHLFVNSPNSGGTTFCAGPGYDAINRNTNASTTGISINNNGSGQTHNHTLPSFDVQYVDFIIATKS